MWPGLEAGLGKDCPIGRGNETGLLGGDRVSLGGVAYGSLLSRRRLATSRDMGWKMASPTDGKDRLRDLSAVTSLFAVLGTSTVCLPLDLRFFPWVPTLSFPLFLRMRVRPQAHRFFTAAPEVLGFPSVPRGWRRAPSWGAF